MSIKPILFNTEMVKAILEGRKTVTRRGVKPQPPATSHVSKVKNDYGWSFWEDNPEKHYMKPPYKTGDVLWVRETFRDLPITPDGKMLNHVFYYYKADGDLRPIGWRDNWRPSIHMPKEAARIFLRVTDVRAERLQNITEDDVCAEGAEPLIQCPYEHPTYGPDGTLEDMCWNTDCCGGCEYIGKSYGELFGELIWDSTIKPADQPTYGWEVNPWVWVIEFERCEKPEGWPC